MLPLFNKQEKNFRLDLKLKEIRERASLTQQQLAELCGCTAEMLSAYENNRQMPSMFTVRALCKALNVTSDELLGLD